MTYIIKKGVIYNVLEEVVDLAEENNKLNIYEGAILSDERELEEYNAKIAEINLLDIPQPLKKELKQSVRISQSLITKEMLREQRKLVKTLTEL